MFSFLLLINNSIAIGSISISIYISDQIIKEDQYFTFFIGIVFTNIFININHIIRVFNKSFRIIIMIAFAN